MGLGRFVCRVDRFRRLVPRGTAVGANYLQARRNVMGEKLNEGLLYDLLTKRRNGQFTADELLFAADHPEFIRWAMAHPKEAKGLCERTLMTVKREFSPSEVYARELGFEVVEGEDVARTLKSAADLEAVSFLEPEDYGRVSGETMRARGKAKKANLGLADLKVALDDQTKISVEEGVQYIVFSGTLLRFPGGALFVAYLHRNDDGWYLDFRGVAIDWRDIARLARCK